MKYRSIKLLVVVCTALVIFSCEKKETSKQNFVFILVDDLGWTDLGYSGSSFFETPNIDALKESSFQFTNAYSASSVCSPTRASILTGKHPVSLNITDWIPGHGYDQRKLRTPQISNELPLDEITFAEVLKKHNYSTFFAGKWHLGGLGFYPENNGFDINIGGNHTGSPQGGYYSPYKNPNLKNINDGEYLTDRLTNESITFLDTVGENPFLLYLSFYTVHAPIQPNVSYLKKFEDKLTTITNISPDTLRFENGGKTRLNQFNPDYASMVYALDVNVGRLVQKLKDKGLYDNTTIIFTSDNGSLTTNSTERPYMSPTSVLPLRAGKGWLYEGGIRIPLLIKPAQYNGTSKTVDQPIISYDFYPTILSMADIEIENSSKIDGKDFSTLLQKTPGDFRRKELFWYYPHYHASGWAPGSAIRIDNWKLIEFYESNEVELYNLDNDISESKNLADKYPSKRDTLYERLQDFKKRMKAKSVTPNPNYSAQN